MLNVESVHMFVRHVSVKHHFKNTTEKTRQSTLLIPVGGVHQGSMPKVRKYLLCSYKKEDGHINILISFEAHQ